MATSSSETDYVTVLKSEGEANIQDVVAHSDMPNVEVDVKVVGETGFNQNNQTGSQGEPPNPVPGNKDRAFYSQASDLGIEMAKECRALSFDTYNVEESRQLAVATVAQPSNAEEDILESGKDTTAKDVGSAIPAAVPQQVAPTTKGKRQKGKSAQGSGPSSPSPSAFNSTDSSSEPVVSSSIPSEQAVFTQIMKMQETLNQVLFCTSLSEFEFIHLCAWL